MTTKDILLQKIEDSLQAQFKDNQLLSSRLQHAISYSLFPGGKRIRPLIALSLVNDLGANIKSAAKIVTPLELIHCSSLIHDDLPALDNDDYRRGKESCHKKYGDGVATLAGDSLIGVSFHILSSISEPSLSIKLISELSFAFIQLCNGQELDIADLESRGETEEIHLQKTGALFGASFLFGLHLARIEDAYLLKHGRECGGKFGLFFQILDDYLDQYGDPEKRGRPSGSDQKNNKQTIISNTTKNRVLEKLQDLRKEVLMHFQNIEDRFRIERSLTKEILYEILSVEKHFT